MTKKPISTKSVVYYIVLIIVVLLMVIPTSRKWMAEGMQKIGLFKPAIEQAKSASTMPVSPLLAVETAMFSDDTGKTFSTQDLKGKVVFLNFWATWCGPCRDEMPSIQALYNKYKDHDQIEFLLVEIEHNADGAKEFLAKENLKLPIFYPESEIPEAWLSGSIPSTVVLDKQGNRVFDHKGMADYSTKEFEDFIISQINK
ncbi:redoxin family protein [Sphingobacterium sp. HJSM2_6]|uniref:redoxin family protein n=1 Tax=Sphingobacterium sp. HJSM2_6 TaxID=3366264 RepID=UPI003BDF1401